MRTVASLTISISPDTLLAPHRLEVVAHALVRVPVRSPWSGDSQDNVGTGREHVEEVERMREGERVAWLLAVASFPRRSKKQKLRTTQVWKKSQHTPPEFKEHTDKQQNLLWRADKRLSRLLVRRHRVPSAKPRREACEVSCGGKSANVGPAISPTSSLAHGYIQYGLDEGGLGPRRPLPHPAFQPRGRALTVLFLLPVGR